MKSFAGYNDESTESAWKRERGMMIMMNIKKGVVLRNNISKTVVPLNYMNLEKKKKWNDWKRECIEGLRVEDGWKLLHKTMNVSDVTASGDNGCKVRAIYLIFFSIVAIKRKDNAS